MDIIDLIKENITRKGLSISELSRISGVSRTGLRYILNKDKSPTIGTLTKICNALDLPAPKINSAVSENKEASADITPAEALWLYAKKKLGRDPKNEDLRDIDLATDIVIKRLENERK